MNTGLISNSKSFSKYIREKFIEKIFSEFSADGSNRKNKIEKKCLNVYNTQDNNLLVADILKYREERQNKLFLSDINKILNNDIKTINIENFRTSKELKNFVFNIINSLNDKLYGIILTSKTREEVCVTNFLAFSRAFEEEYNVFDKMHIYTVKDEFENGSFDEKTKNRLVNCYALMLDNSEFEFYSIITISETEKNMFRNTNQALVESGLIERVFNEESKEYSFNKVEKFYSLVYHDILVDGYMLPYYSASIIERYAQNSKGYDIFGCVSPNISSSKLVCTGSSKNYTNDGLSTLKKANLMSPYRKDIFSENWLDISKTNIELVRAILKKEVKDDN